MANKVPLPCGHTITIDGTLKMREFRGWIQAEKAADFEQLYGYLARLISAWDWEGLDPHVPESYDELDIAEYKQITEAVSNHVLSAISAKN